MMTTAMAGIDLPRLVTEIRIDNRKRRPTQAEDIDDNGVLVCGACSSSEDRRHSLRKTIE